MSEYAASIRGPTRDEVFGSIRVRLTASGNLLINKTHSPAESLTVEAADVPDLMVALDYALESDERFHGKWDDAVEAGRDAALHAWRNVVISMGREFDHAEQRAFDRYWSGK